jgi:His-Xaa-Ser system protein HxsD
MKSPVIRVDTFVDGSEYAVLEIHQGVYDLKTIQAAGYVFLDKAYILLDMNERQRIEVYLFPKDKAMDAKTCALEFSNELVNYAHYFTRVESNAEVSKTIMQRVLFSVNPKAASEAEEQEIQELLKELESESAPRKKKKR